MTGIFARVRKSRGERVGLRMMQEGCLLYLVTAGPSGESVDGLTLTRR
ncbi:MAG TPA: hypothetical protein VF834_08470 [Streptosporangiaceae bacterium]